MLPRFAKQEGGRRLQTPDGCYSAPGVAISDCSCHWTCRSCGYNDEPSEYNDCIDCADFSAVVPVFSDGTGTCHISAGDYTLEDDDFDDDFAACESEYIELFSCYEANGEDDNEDDDDDEDDEDDDFLASCEAYAFVTALTCASTDDDSACVDEFQDALVCIFEHQAAQQGLECDLGAACGSSDSESDAAVKTAALSGLAIMAALAALL